MKPEQERLRTVLADTVNLLCKSGLQFTRELRVQALIGVTVDDDEVFVVHINESHPGGSSTVPIGPPKSQTSMGTPRFMHPKSPAAQSRSPAVGPTGPMGGTSMALVPYSPQQRMSGTPIRKTPQSFGKKMRGSPGGLMSPAAKQVTLKAKQKLQFSSLGAGRGGLSPRGMMKSARGGMPGGSPRGSLRGGASPRGGPAGVASSPRGGFSSPQHNNHSEMGRGAPSTPRGRGRPPGAGNSPRMSFSHSGNNPSRPPTASPQPRSASNTPQPQRQQMPPSSYQSQGVPQFSSTLDYSQPHSTLEDLPSLQRAPTGQPPTKRIKTEKPDSSDIIDLDDEGVATQYMDDGGSVDSSGGTVGIIPPGMVQQTQITRLTITTNAQGQPVHQYERVQSATVPSGVGSNSTGLGGVKTEVGGGLVEGQYAANDFLPDILGSASAGSYSEADGTSYGGYQGDVYHGESGYQGDAYQGSYADGGVDYGGGDYKMSERMGNSSGGMTSWTGIPLQGETSQGGWMGGAMKSDYSENMHGGKMGSGFPQGAGEQPMKSSRGGRGGGGGAPRGAPRGSRGPRGARRPNAESFSEVKGRGGGAEGGGTWKMVARFVCNIPGCDQSFSNKSNLLRHQNQKHGRASSGGGSMDGGGGDDDDDDFDDMYDDAMI